MVDQETRINEYLDEWEELIEDDHYDVVDINVRIRVAMFAELGRLGMSPSYRQQFVCSCPIKVEVELTEEQEQRLTNIAVAMARNVYLRFTEAGFNDDAIALLGPQFEFYLREI